MVYAEDLKSSDLKVLRVRFPPIARMADKKYHVKRITGEIKNFNNLREAINDAVREGGRVIFFIQQMERK